MWVSAPLAGGGSNFGVPLTGYVPWSHWGGLSRHAAGCDHTSSRFLHRYSQLFNTTTTTWLGLLGCTRRPREAPPISGSHVQ